MFTWERFLFWEAFHKHLPTPGQEEQLSCCVCVHSLMQQCTHFHDPRRAYNTGAGKGMCTNNWTINNKTCAVPHVVIFKFYLMLFDTTRKVYYRPSNNIGITGQQLMFSLRSVLKLHLLLFRNQWPHRFVSSITSFSPCSPRLVPTAGRKACATKRIYGYVCIATVAWSYQS